MEAAEISRLEEVVDVHQWEHDQGAHQGAELLHRSVPHEGAVAVAPEDHPQHHLDIGKHPNKEHPGDDLLAERRV